MAAFSALNAVAVSMGGAASAFLGGVLADRWAATDARARTWIPAGGCLLAVLAITGVLYLPTFNASIALVFVHLLVAECWFGPTVSLLQSELPSRLHGSATSLLMFFGALVGSIAPLIVGILDKQLVGAFIDSDSRLRFILVTVVGGSYITCALAFFACGRTMSMSKDNK
ncbi:hypothetical protein CYMTET_18690 [Cymbomonas tetramitiformis]|uniref:Major facilitator superfamily (MFS) profile domain-containing protein n=1 Tax=Cymbomonas tetramitiformis TaxID=36881 RepID=A0AAE0L5M7_9CHLO|nr:hypothetical protein CYMTET_18690 [Cymbomonas tetramitiformis]